MSVALLHAVCLVFFHVQKRGAAHLVRRHHHGGGVDEKSTEKRLKETEDRLELLKMALYKRKREKVMRGEGEGEEEEEEEEQEQGGEEEEEEEDEKGNWTVGGKVKKRQDGMEEDGRATQQKEGQNEMGSMLQMDQVFVGTDKAKDPEFENPRNQ